MLIMKSRKRHVKDEMQLPNKKRLERSEKRKPANTREYWKLIQSNKWK